MPAAHWGHTGVKSELQNCNRGYLTCDSVPQQERREIFSAICNPACVHFAVFFTQWRHCFEYTEVR